MWQVGQESIRGRKEKRRQRNGIKRRMGEYGVKEKKNTVTQAKKTASYKENAKIL